MSEKFIILVKSVVGYLARLAGRVLRRLLQIPLLAFFVLPLLAIIIYLQETNMESLSGFLLSVLFLGQPVSVHGFRELAIAVGGWLIIIELVSELIEWIFARRKWIFPGGILAVVTLSVLYLAAGFIITAGMRQTDPNANIWPYIAVMFVLGLITLKFYQYIGALIQRRAKTTPNLIVS